MINDDASPRGSHRFLIVFAAIGLAASWLVAAIASWQNAPDLGHSWVVPLLMAYLWWERWPERPETNARQVRAGWWLLAMTLVLVALPLRLVLVPYPLWPMILTVYTALMALIGMLAAWLIAGGKGVRWLTPPMILMASALPIPALVESRLIVPLREFLAGLAAEISNLLGQPALAVGTSVKLTNDWVGVDEACGGIRSLQACLMVGLFFGEWYRLNWSRRLSLVAVGLILAVGGNFARVLFLSLRAGDGIAAVSEVHDISGWVAMITSLGVTGWLACHWAGYRWPAVGRRESRPGGGFAVGWVWLAVVVLGLGLNEAGARWWFARGEAERGSVARWTAHLPEDHWSFVGQPLGDAARDMLRPDDFRAGFWRLESGEMASSYFVEWRTGQIARFVPFMHNPTVCLPLAGCELVSTLDPIVVQWEEGEISFFAYKFHRLGEYLLVAFTIWDPTRGQALVKQGEGQTQLEFWRGRWAEVAEARKDQPAQLLTVTIPWQNNASEQMKDLLQSLVVPISAQ